MLRSFVTVFVVLPRSPPRRLGDGPHRLHPGHGHVADFRRRQGRPAESRRHRAEILTFESGPAMIQALASARSTSASRASRRWRWRAPRAST